MRILNDKQQALLVDERSLLNDLRVALVQFGAPVDDEQTLAQSIRQLDELFLLVVVGEFNAGKSAFINAFLGEQLLKEGVTPTTTQIHVLRFGENGGRQVENESLHVITAPHDLLKEISIVDTPGTNAIIREHEAITAQFVPRSDLVLFITSADRPFTESERQFLEHIREWGKKVVVVLNKIDLFQSKAEQAQVQSYIAENARALFGVSPEIFPVSSRLALRAKQGEPALWAESCFGALEDYIQETLDESGRLRLKFLNPLGVAKHLVEAYLGVVRERLDLLKADFAMLDDVEGQLGVYRQDMDRDFNYRMADIENVLYGMEQRGQDYFDETMRLARILDLVKKERIQQEFARTVVSDAPQVVEKKVGELIDWLVDSDLRQWQAVMDHLAERRRQHKERIVGDALGGSFHHDRQRLIEAVTREAGRVVETYDKDREAEAIAAGAQSAVAALAAAEVSALSLGALVAILATTAAADITGVLLASVMAALGLFIIPARRKQAKAELREKIGEMRTQLVQSLQSQFEQEMERSLQRINEAIAPYTRFVRAERDKLNEVKTKLEVINQSLVQLEARVEDLQGS
jgi:small GTP-binding protein